MDKLIELLNEYEKKRIKAVNAKWLSYNIKLLFRPYTESNLTNEAYKSVWLEICSKYYGFIKRLVDNDKIDLYRVKRHFYDDLYAIDYGDGYYMCPDYEIAIAVLSIQETPISFLISILK